MEIPRHISCPICGVVRRKPSLHIPSTSWVDGCSCNDHGRCVYHRLNPHETPERPSQETLYERALKKQDAEVSSYMKVVDQFGNIARLKVRLDEKIRLLDRVAESLSEAIKNPDTMSATLIDVIRFINKETEHDRETT